MAINSYFWGTQKAKPHTLGMDVAGLWRKLGSVAERRFPGYEAPEDIGGFVSFTTSSSTLRMGNEVVIGINLHDLNMEAVLFRFAFFSDAKECLVATDLLIQRNLLAALHARGHTRQGAALLMALESAPPRGQQWGMQESDVALRAYVARTSGGEVLPEADREMISGALKDYQTYRRGFIFAHELAHGLVRGEARQYAELLVADLLAWGRAHQEDVRQISGAIWSHEIETAENETPFMLLVSAAANDALVAAIPEQLAGYPSIREEVLCDLLAADLMQHIGGEHSSWSLATFDVLSRINCRYWKWLALGQVKHLGAAQGDEATLDSHYCCRQIRNLLSIWWLEREKAEHLATHPQAHEELNLLSCVVGRTLERLYVVKQDPVFRARCSDAALLAQAQDSFGDRIAGISDDELSACLDDYLIGDNREGWYGIDQSRPPFRQSALGRLCQTRQAWWSRKRWWQSKA